MTLKIETCSEENKVHPWIECASPREIQDFLDNIVIKTVSGANHVEWTKR